MKVPIRAIDLAVPHVSHQRQHVCIDNCTVAGTGLDDSNRKSVAKIMDSRSGLTRAGVDSHRTHETQEYGDDAGVPNTTTTQRHEQVVVVRDSTLVQVPLEARGRRCM